MADESDNNSNESKPAPEPAAKKKAPKKKKGKERRSSSGEAKPKRAFRSYPSISLEKALQVAYEIREKNGGNPWATDQVAAALGLSPKGTDFYCVFHPKWTVIPGHRGQRRGVGGDRRRFFSAVHDELLG